MPMPAFFYALVGSADDPSVPTDGKRFFTSLEYIGGSTKSWLHIRWHLQKVENTLSWASSEQFRWKFTDKDNVKVLGSGGGFYVGQDIEIKRGSEATNVISGQDAYPSTNPFVSGHPDVAGDVSFTFSGKVFTVKNVTENEILGDRNQAWRYEVFGSALNKQPQNPEIEGSKGEESEEKEWIWMNDLPEDKAFYYWRKADKANKDKKNA